MKKVLFITLLLCLLPNLVSAEGYYFHEDHLGGSSIVTNEEGEVVAEYNYMPYGELFDEVVYDEDFSNSYKFTDQEEDSETGLYYYGARYYNAGVGRFMAQDPAVYDERLFELLQDPQSLNAYAYVRNNPVKYVDPSGEFPDFIWDLANFVFDFITGDTDDMALDLIAATIPGVPAVANVDDAAQALTKASDKVGELVSTFSSKIDNVVSAVVTKSDEVISSSTKLSDLTKRSIFLSKNNKTSIWGKTGGYDQALQDFEKLTDGVYDTSKDGKVIYSVLDDGTKVSVRDFSSDGRATIQIDKIDGSVTKYRYD